MRKGVLKFAPACFLFLTCFTGAAAPPPRAISIDEVMALRSVSDPHLSPDGQSVVFTVTEADQNANRDVSNLWIAPVMGGQPARLTQQTSKNDHPRWSPDGRWIAFLSDRDSVD